MPPTGKKVYIETYGCQMNVADSEIVLGLLSGEGYELTDEPEVADVVLVNTCSIRKHAEQRVYGRLGQFKHLKKKNPKAVIGEDELPWKEIFEICETTGNTQWYIVEYEVGGVPSLEAVEKCLAGMKKLGRA